MPYITQTTREIYDNLAKELASRIRTANAKTAMGEFNYFISKTIDEIMKSEYHYNYHSMNEIMGMLESVKQEYYRRVVAPYEDKKKDKNGDVYTER